MLNSLNINHIKLNEMTFEFFLSASGKQKNIYLSLTDNQQNKTYTFRTHLRISDDDWDKEKQEAVLQFKRASFEETADAAV